MATKLKVPTTGDGLREVLTDPAKVSEFFGPGAVANGQTKEFLDAYAKDYVARNGDAQDDLRTQVQSELFNLIRDDGGGRRPGLDVSKLLSWRGGRPSLDQTAVSKGRGSVYNSTSVGAEMERRFPEKDRFASIGELCLAIREQVAPSARPDRAEMMRKLENLRGFQDNIRNSFGSEDPGAGGFLIPEIMRSELLQLALEDTIVRRNATVIPMSTLRVPVPTVDDTSHVSSLFGGVTFYWTEEAASLTESTAKFGRIVLDAKKLTGFFKVPNELLADAPAFSTWFDSRVPKGLAWYEDLAFMTGTGVGEPLGFIGSPAYVSVDRAVTNQIAWSDIVTMYSRMLPTSLPSAVWIAAIDSFPQLAQLTGPSGNPGIWLGGWASRDATDAPPISILGRPVYFTEKAPSTTISGGAAGDLSFVDLSYYLIGDRQAVAVSASEHFLFQNDQTAYRLIERVDGRPWLQSALTPHNNSPATLSAYVGLSQTHT